jgi:hypothetical protein
MDDHGTRSLPRPAFVGTQTARRSFPPPRAQWFALAFGLIAHPARGHARAMTEEGADA